SLSRSFCLTWSGSRMNCVEGKDNHLLALEEGTIMVIRINAIDTPVGRIRAVPGISGCIRDSEAGAWKFRQ
ncbi:MAG: hypothetical protein KAJ10_01295, partial [Thermodesulfovibrionia bacterium]|nr:hypothetical protein [Thermodesulfovibrionia bacterium]